MEPSPILLFLPAGKAGWGPGEDPAGPWHTCIAKFTSHMWGGLAEGSLETPTPLWVQY